MTVKESQPTVDNLPATLVMNNKDDTDEPASLLMEEAQLAATQPNTVDFGMSIPSRSLNAHGMRDSGSIDDEEKEIEKQRVWNESPFAVGLVNTKWSDECVSMKRANHHWISGYVCGSLGAGRVGNLVVFRQGEEEYDHVSVDEDTGEGTTSRRKRPTLLWVVGPYWPMNMCVTYPLIIGVSLYTVITKLQDQALYIIVLWSLCIFAMLSSLAMVACRNPGVLYRHHRRPTGEDSEDWRWNDQARTFRPKKARFDPECGVVIEGFDHTCPWTGTAIGSRNMFWFHVFTTTVPISIAFTVSLHLLF